MMRTRKMNKTIVAVLAICAAFLISSMYFIPSNAEATGELVVWGKTAENPNDYDRTNSNASEWKRPTMDGYYFAGWYDSVESTEAISDISSVKSAYPKFVREDALSVYCQVALKNTGGTYTSSHEDGSKNFAKVDVRILTSVDTLQYKQVSFLLGTSQSTVVEMETVYKTVTGSNENADVVSYTAKDVCDAYGEDEGYLAAAYIKDLCSYENSDGQNSFERDIVITPTWTTMDGTIVKGNTAYKQVVGDDRVAGCEAMMSSIGEAGDVSFLWYYEFTDAQAKANASDSDVEIILRKDLTLSDSLNTVTNGANATYTLNGAGHTIDASNLGTNTTFLMNSTNYSGYKFNLKNVTVKHQTTSNAKVLYATKNVEVTFEGVTISSTAPCSTNKTAGYGLMVFAGTSDTRLTIDITLNDTEIDWTPTTTTNAYGNIVLNYVTQADITVMGESTLTGYEKSIVYLRNTTANDVIDVVDGTIAGIMKEQVTGNNHKATINYTVPGEN